MFAPPGTDRWPSDQAPLIVESVESLSYSMDSPEKSLSNTAGISLIRWRALGGRTATARGSTALSASLSELSSLELELELPVSDEFDVLTSGLS